MINTLFQKSEYIVHNIVLVFLNDAYFIILWMSRLRLIKTDKFLGLRDQASSRLGKFLNVETETHQDREIFWMLRGRSVKTPLFVYSGGIFPFIICV